jgi:hypothetical protein
MRDGGVVYWRIDAPDAEEYRMEWRWDPPNPPRLIAGCGTDVRS